MKIGDRIKALRLTQGNISKSELAVAIDIPESKVSSYEKNLSRPPHQILLKIAEYFKVPAEFFFEDVNIETTAENNSEITTKKNFEEINIIKSKISPTPKSENQKPLLKKESVQLKNIDSNNNKLFQIIHNDLLSIKTLLKKLIEVESNKPNFNNIKNIVRVHNVGEANKYLKKGFVLLELFKDDKGQLGFTLGGEQEE